MIVCTLEFPILSHSHTAKYKQHSSCGHGTCIYSTCRQLGQFSLQAYLLLTTMCSLTNDQIACVIYGSLIGNHIFWIITVQLIMDHHWNVVSMVSCGSVVAYIAILKLVFSMSTSPPQFPLDITASGSLLFHQYEYESRV